MLRMPGSLRYGSQREFFPAMVLPDKVLVGEISRCSHAMKSRVGMMT